MQRIDEENDENHSPQFIRQPRPQVFRSSIGKDALKPQPLSPPASPKINNARSVLQLRTQSPPPAQVPATIPTVIAPVISPIISPPTSPSLASNHTTFTIHSLSLYSPVASLSLQISYKSHSYTTHCKCSHPTYTPNTCTSSFITTPGAMLKLILVSPQYTLHFTIPTSTRLTSLPLLHNGSSIGTLKLSMQNLQEVFLILLSY